MTGVFTYLSPRQQKEKQNEEHIRINRWQVYKLFYPLNKIKSIKARNDGEGKNLKDYLYEKL